MGKDNYGSKKQMRNLQQYKDLSDEEFEDIWLERFSSTTLKQEFEDRIAKKLEEFSADYDIDDLKINDRETLRAFLQAIIALEDYERIIFGIRSEEITQANINVVDRLSRVASDLRKDISRFQDDLVITRRIRKADKESSVVAYIASLKEQARNYMEAKLSYIFCPNCNRLLGNVWALYPDADNKITFKCKSTLADGSECGTKVTVTTKELMENRGTNKPEVMPEALL